MHEELKKFATFLMKPLDNKKNKCYNRLIKGKEKRKKWINELVTKSSWTQKLVR
jgi:hypothetical protein